MEDEDIPFWILEGGHVADAGVDRRTGEGDAAPFQCRPRGMYIGDVQGDPLALGTVLEPHGLGVDQVEGEVGRLELGEVLGGKENRALEAKGAPIEVGAGREVARGDADEVDARDELVIGGVGHGLSMPEALPGAARRRRERGGGGATDRYDLRPWR